MGHCGSWSGGPAQLPNKGWQVAEDQMLSKQILDTWGNGENTTAEQEKKTKKAKLLLGLSGYTGDNLSNGMEQFHWNCQGEGWLSY